MSVSLDHLMTREFRPEYTCIEFAREVWLALTGEDLRVRLGALLAGPSQRSVPTDIRHGFRRLARPEAPCLVLMMQLGLDPHLGVFWEGGMIHLNTSGAECFPLEIAGRGFTSFRYYK